MGCELRRLRISTVCCLAITKENSRIDPSLLGGSGDVAFDFFRRDITIDRDALPLRGRVHRQLGCSVRACIGRCAWLAIADDQFAVIDCDLAARARDRANAGRWMLCHRGIKFDLYREIAVEHHRWKAPKVSMSNGCWMVCMAASPWCCICGD